MCSQIEEGSELWKEIDCDIFSQENLITDEIQQLMEEDEADGEWDNNGLAQVNRALNTDCAEECLATLEGWKVFKCVR